VSGLISGLLIASSDIAGGAARSGKQRATAAFPLGPPTVADLESERKGSMPRPLMMLLSLVLAALSFAPSYAHVLEAGPRLHDWPPELWRAATVFHGQFAWFAIIGAPIDVAAIVMLAVMAFALRSRRPTFWFALAAAGLFLAGLLAWAAIVAPANGVLATWQPGPIPRDFTAVRARWETGHIVVAALKALGFVALCIAATFPGRRLALRSAARSRGPGYWRRW
jgi:hypothetical protein